MSDPTADPLTVSFYGRDTQPADFTIAVIPDTQYYVSSLNGGTPALFSDQTNWIFDHQQTNNIAFVTHLGDVVQNGDLVPAEWFNAADAMYRLEYPTPELSEGIPYGLTVGNHDQTPFNDPNGTTTLFNQYFGEAHFAGRAYYGGHYGSNNDNSYQLVSASGIDLIIVHLEFDPSANPAVLAWANALLQTHSNRLAIVVTHHVVGTGNPAAFSTQGQAIYDALKANPNLILMLGRHISGEGRRQDTFNGNTVHSLLSDYQGRINGGDGWMRILEFSPADDEIRVKTYSPTLDQFEIDADSQFTLSVPLDPGFKLIGENQNVSSGTSTSVFWSHAEVDSVYEWYVAITDSTGRETQSPVWGFDTAPSDSTAPIISGTMAINVTDQAAEIVWNTDEISDSVVEYGLDSLYRLQESSSSLVASHSVVLGNLALDQTYHYRVGSTDSAGNTTFGVDRTFKTAAVDLTPPTPNPMTWASAPASAGPGTITMTASTASDSSGVEYSFENLTDPSHDRGWQVSPNFTDSLLLHDTSYTYRVQARDLSAANNETGFSTPQSAMTIAGSAFVLRGPYLQNGKPDGVSIMWRTDNFTDGRVWYGDSPSNLDQVIDEPTPPPPLIARGANWIYLDDGSNQGAAWKETSFVDSTWSQGSAELGYGDGDEATVVSYGPDSANKFTTTYFRHTFTVTGASELTNLELGLLRDDGAVVYLNGTELRRDNMPGGAVSYDTFASSAVGSITESTYFVSSVDPSLLVEGNNVLTVEVHQANLTSSDISFDLDLYIPQPGGGGDGFDHLVRLSGLNSNRTYYYQVGTAQGEILAGGDSNHYFKTLPAPGSIQPVRIWALGDSGTADGNARAVRDAYLDLAAAERPADLLLMLGDNAYSTGTDAEYQSAVFENMYEDILRNRVVWPTQGNHDLDAYFNVFDLPMAGEAGGIPSGTEDYYSFDIANVHLICLNSQDLAYCSDPNSVMYQWLDADLLATTQPWIIAFWHHPAYSKGSHDSDDPADSQGRLENMRTIALPILEAGGVDLVLAGHSHSYERSMFINGHYGLSGSFDSVTHVVQSGDGDPAGDGAYAKNGVAGAVYVTAGNSGKISGVSQHAAMQVWLNNLGSVIVDVDNDQMDVRFLRELSAPFQIDDGFQITKNLGSDLDPPTPDPMTWASVPAPVDNTSIIMTASTAADASGIAYLFENITDSTHNSGWQTSASYTDSGLAPDTTYSYRVKARDLSPAQNETAFSSPASASTDLSAPAPDPMTWAALPTAIDSTSVLMTATTASDPSGVEYFFENITDPAHSSGWQASPSYMDAGLPPDATHTYRVKARDRSLVQNETAFSSSESVSTDLTAPAPDPMTWTTLPAAVDSTSITMVATTASDPSGVEYFFENVTEPVHNSGWQASPSYTNQGLNPNSTYAYRVRARDLSLASNETASSSTESAITDPPPDLTAPSPDPMAWATVPAAVDTTSITMTAVTASDPSDVEYFFENVTDSVHNSGWQTSASYTDTSLSPASEYVYRVRARDLSPARNETALSAAEAATADSPPDLSPPAPNPMTWAAVPTAVDSTSITMTATTASDPSGVEYFFENVTIPGHTGDWQTSPTWLDGGLASGTSYTYRVTARDFSPDQNTTIPSSAESATTLSPQPIELFADGFESGDLTTGGWTTQNSGAVARSSAVFTGLFGAELKKTTWMERGVSTVGYGSITVTFACQTVAFDNGEMLVAEWSVGGAWILIESTQTTTYKVFGPITLTSGADDNAAFRIRFSTNANRNNEKARIDDVRITGIPTSPPAAPGPASGPNPVDGASGVSAIALPGWTAGNGATSHDVYFGTNPIPGAAEFQGNQLETSFAPGPLGYDLTYYWRIDEVNATGTTTGAVWSFTTQSPPPAPGSASTPNPADSANGVNVTTTLGWTAGSDVTSHDVYFGLNPNPSVSDFKGNQPGTSFDPGPLVPDVTYYWRIDEVNTTGTTTGAVWSFTTSATSAPVALLSDDFESGGFSAGGWTTQNTYATVKGSSAFAGRFGAELKRSAWIEAGVSTAGYHTIHLKYVRRTEKLDAGESLYAEWSIDGAAWNVLESTQESVWGQKDWALPAAAADNANFRIRFRLESNANNEKARIDNVELTGTAL